MKDIIEALKGKKTYIIAIIVIVVALVESVLKIDVPGVDVVNPLEWILAAFGMSALRAGSTNGSTTGGTTVRSS
jgi:hypothetical protein